MITPYPDQIDFTNKIIRKIADGYTRVCCQASTGFGKTVVFSYITSRYLERNPSARICILVHRRKLKVQTEATLRKFGIHNVMVEMVETFNNAIRKHNRQFDFLIADEAHIANHFKVVTHFTQTQPDCIILGFTATPIAASKKTPLKSFFQTIVCATPINELIKMGRLCPAIHYSPKNEIGKISVSGNDYNMTQMGIEFSKPKLVDAVVHAYEHYANGKKALVFNTTIEHSNLVHEAFLKAGHPSRVIDSKNFTDEQIQATYDWVRDTLGAILNSVEMATTGYDEPTIEAVLHNYKTKSLPKWLQTSGRGGRVSPGKEFFLNIDLGDNIDSEGFGHWNERHDWEQYFFHPEKYVEGVAPMKKCPACDARIYMSSTRCIWCGHEMERKTVYTDMVLELGILPEKGVKRNSHDSLMNAIATAAQRIQAQRLRLNERRELMFYAFKSLYEMSSFEPKVHIISHLVSVYVK